VIDEAQVAAALREGHFASSEGHTRPILRELAKIMSDTISHLILCGTGLSIDVVETVVRSVVAKDGEAPPIKFTETGAFNLPDEQREYLDKYLPAAFVDTSLGQCLMGRLNLWLHGRYVEMFNSQKNTHCGPDIGLPHRTSLLYSEMNSNRLIVS
jgi:hypothetical protein